MPRHGLWHFDRQWTHFDDQVLAYSIQQAFSAIWTSVLPLSIYLEIRTFSMIFDKPGFMADTLLILTLPSFQSLWLFPMSTLWFSQDYWSRSEASQDVVRPLTLRLLMNAPPASCMTCAMQGVRFLKGGHWIPEASSVDCSSHVIKLFKEASSLVIQSGRPSISSKRSRTSSKCMASLAGGCWPLSYHP